MPLAETGALVLKALEAAVEELHGATPRAERARRRLPIPGLKAMFTGNADTHDRNS